MIAFMVRMLTEKTVNRKLDDVPNHELWWRVLWHQVELIAALHTGDPEAACQTMASHVTAAEELMQRQEARLTRRFLSG